MYFSLSILCCLLNPRSADVPCLVLQHGQEILDSLGEIKSALVTRFENYQSRYPQGSQPPEHDDGSHRLAPQALSSRAGNSPASIISASSASTPSSSESFSRSSLVNGRRTRTPSPYRQGSQEDDYSRRTREDAMQRDEDRRRDAERSRYGPTRSDSDGARQGEWAQAEQMRIDHERSREQEAQRQQDDMRRREEEIRQRLADRRRQEHDSIARRQQESEAAAQAVRQTPGVYMPQPSSSLAMPAAGYAASSTSGMSYGYRSGSNTLNAPVLQMPLESPTK